MYNTLTAAPLALATLSILRHSNPATTLVSFCSPFSRSFLIFSSLFFVPLPRGFLQYLLLSRRAQLFQPYCAPKLPEEPRLSRTESAPLYLDCHEFLVLRLRLVWIHRNGEGCNTVEAMVPLILTCLSIAE